MAEPASSETGFFENTRALLSAFAQYLHARIRLAGIETKEALVHYAILIALLVLALCIVVFGYLFLCIGLVVLIAHLLHIRPEWIIIAFALLHFCAAIICVLIIKARLTASMFSATIEEFKKDQQWLSTPKQN